MEKIVRIKFDNFHRIYNYKTELPLRRGTAYKISTANGDRYCTAVRVIGYADAAPEGIQLKTITSAEEVEDT